MTLAETIYQHSQKLPEPAAREALAFILDLEKRYAATDIPTDLTPEQRAAYTRLSGLNIEWAGQPIADREQANAR